MPLSRKIFGGAVIATAAIAAARVSARRSSPPELPPPGAGIPGSFPWRHADLFFTRAGAGPAALLLHDVYDGASGAEMAPLAARLSEGLETTLLDLPGFGRSGRPRLRFGPDLFFDAIVEFVRHEIDAPALLIGSGLSAAYAVEAAGRLGRLALGVVLIAPPEPSGVAGIEIPAWRPLAYQALRSPIGDAIRLWRSSAAGRRRLLERSLAVTPPDIEERADDLRRFARQPDSGWPVWSLWAGDLAWDPRPALSRLGAPALVLWGAEARANAAAPEAYGAVRPDMPQHVVPGTGRWPHLDAPDAVAERIREWWGGEGVAAVQPPAKGGRR
ncbi:MAG TPA: alpha/beta hydrolase [Gemmatimonadota bacterium]|nr:alpha/beta hydrolase [Gemmatimonadota bacterium]